MSDFKAIMYQIQFRLGLRPRPRWGSLQRSPRPPTGLKGLLLRGGERTGRERGRDGRGEGEGTGRARGREETRHHPFAPPLIHISGYAPAEYRGISKYRNRIDMKNTDENTEYRYRLQIPIPTQL